MVVKTLTVDGQRARFTRLQARAQLFHSRAEAYWRQLNLKYGNSCPRGMRAELERRRAVAARAWDKFFAFLTEISPRAWGQYVPCNWILDSLTFDDATTAGQLAVVPPCAYGATPRDLQLFAAPVVVSVRIVGVE